MSSTVTVVAAVAMAAAVALIVVIQIAGSVSREGLHAIAIDQQVAVGIASGSIVLEDLSGCFD